MNKVNVQSLNECFNVSGPEFILMPDDWQSQYDDCTFHLQSKSGKIGGKIGGPRGARTQMNNGIGMWSRTKEQLKQDNSKGGKVAGQKHYQNGTGIFSISSTERKNAITKGGKSTGNQRWKCLETGKVLGPGPLTQYQKARGIDVKKRIKL